MKRSLKQSLQKIMMYAHLFGFYPYKFFKTLRGIPSFIGNYLEFSKQLKQSKSLFTVDIFPCFDDARDSAGIASGHYFNQDLLVANRIFHNNPERHVDIGSRFDGFVAHVASFREIEVIDIRPIHYKIHNIKFVQMDMMANDINMIDYTDSISSLHAIEHFGLGRYGDKIDVNGHIKGFDNMYRMLKRYGKLYFSIPIGRQRIEYNAQRVFDVKYIIGLINNKYCIDSFSFVNDDGVLNTNIPLVFDEIDRNFSCNYGCGIFELSKI